MSNNVYICGCVKNNAKYLRKVFNNIHKIISLLDDYTIIISYDHSNDNSLNILLDISKEFKNFIIIVNKKKLSKVRTENISNARNRILDKMIELNKKDYKYFMMIDMDDVFVGNLNVKIIEKYLNNDQNWDSISFNRSVYYDFWALSYKPYMYSCWHCDYPRNLIFNVIKPYFLKKLNSLKEDELLKCHSAFNGFAIYKIDKFINCRYDFNINRVKKFIPQKLMKNNMNILKIHSKKKIIGDKKRTTIGDCEHRKFHLEAIKKNNAKIRISPVKLFN